MDQPGPSDDLPRALFRRWLRSHEEETVGAEEVYRPHKWPFPRSRGRSGLELQADGVYMRIGPGPDDRSEARAGRWEVVGPRRLRLGAERVEPEIVEIVAVDDDVLRLRRTGHET